MDRAGVLDATDDVESGLAAADGVLLRSLLLPGSRIPAALAGSIRRLRDAAERELDQPPVSAFGSYI
jgi:chorismate-pyruvate lyase